MKTKVLLLFTSAKFLIGDVQRQAPSDSKQIAISQSDPAKAVRALVNRFEHEITNAATAIPVEKYSFTPVSLSIPRVDFTKVRSFADQV